MNGLKKYGLFTLIYLFLTWMMSSDLSCIWDLEGYCLTNFIGKYLIFMFLMWIYDRFVKHKVFAKTTKK